MKLSQLENQDNEQSIVCHFFLKSSHKELRLLGNMAGNLQP
jgi:hypothetical protein